MESEEVKGWLETNTWDTAEAQKSGMVDEESLEKQTNFPAIKME